MTTANEILVDALVDINALSPGQVLNATNAIPALRKLSRVPLSAMLSASALSNFCCTDDGRPRGATIAIQGVMYTSG